MCSKRFFECAREFGAAWHENGFSTVRKISRQVVAMGKPVDLSEVKQSREFKELEHPQSQGIDGGGSNVCWSSKRKCEYLQCPFKSCQSKK